MVQVSGSPAVMAGFSYLSLAIFVMFCSGPPPGSRFWARQVPYLLLRWGGLAGGLACQVAAWNLRRGYSAIGPLPGSDQVRVWLCLAGVVAIIGFLCFLLAMFEREQVKKDLYAQRLVPLHIWWLPFTHWAEAPVRATAFRVVCADGDGVVQKKYCWTSGWSPQRRVVWLEMDAA
jgi:hypothetical protein